MKFIFCISALVLLICTLEQVCGATEKAVNLPAGGKEGINFASDEDLANADKPKPNAAYQAVDACRVLLLAAVSVGFLLKKLL